MQTRPLTDKEAIMILNATISAMAFSQFLTELSQTSLYRHDLKKNINATKKSLEPMIMDCAIEMIGACEDDFCNLVENRVDFTRQLNELRPENWQIASYILRWANNPDTYYYRAIQAMCLQQDGEDLKLTKAN